MTQAPSDSAALRTLFHDVRLLEFAWFAAGPIAGKWFADLGADVIRVESTTRPDGLRFAGARPPTADPTEPNSSSYYNDFNSSKRSIVLEMNHPESTAVAQRLIEWSDVVTENFRPGVMKRWGLDYETLSCAHPDLIYVTLPAVGLEGPRWFYAGFGSGIKQIAGLTMLTGEDGRPPVGPPPSAFPDFAINCGHGATAIIAALLHRQATGEGQFLEVAQMESTIVVTESAVLEAAVNKHRPPRFANRDRIFCPHNVFSRAPRRHVGYDRRDDARRMDRLVSSHRPGRLADGRALRNIACAAANRRTAGVWHRRLDQHPRCLGDRARHAGCRRACRKGGDQPRIVGAR